MPHIDDVDWNSLSGHDLTKLDNFDHKLRLKGLSQLKGEMNAPAGRKNMVLDMIGTKQTDEIVPRKKDSE